MRDYRSMTGDAVVSGSDGRARARTNGTLECRSRIQQRVGGGGGEKRGQQRKQARFGVTRASLLRSDEVECPCAGRSRQVMCANAHVRMCVYACMMS
uniref:Unkown protein n=1 Tax=Riptortus pedestris TaxID=329032 RepID=R4WQV7_RIPPE|nr:unkown protein [Riptortus pedestris]